MANEFTSKVRWSIFNAYFRGWNDFRYRFGAFDRNESGLVTTALARKRTFVRYKIVLPSGSLQINGLGNLLGRNQTLAAQLNPCGARSFIAVRTR